MKFRFFPRLTLPMFLRRILPQSLFGRSLLILVLPTILIQAVATHIFYSRHWESVSGWMANSLAGEIALLVHEMNGATPEKKSELIFFADKLMGITMTLEAADEEMQFLRSGRDVSPGFFDALAVRVNLPIALAMVDDDSTLSIRVKMNDEILHALVTRKRLVSSTTYIFIYWMMGTAFLLTAVALVFLRNQIRPIVRLSEVVEAFGKGLDDPGFKPQGAKEVRRAGHAFLHMRHRIERQITARMEMLAGISHDLRTPLTRLKLQLAMLGEKEAAADMQRDVTDMEHMISEYLDFVRGEGQEEPVRMVLRAAVEDILSRYASHGKPVPLTVEDGADGVQVFLRPHVFRRALTNIIDNALRYGKKDVRVVLCRKRQHAEICVDDGGEGIDKALREQVFRPFFRLDKSRNEHTGGVGLGLTISRDIIHAHGGDVILQDNPSGTGLRVLVRLPIASTAR
ncbi:MAG: HAMP domain-containing protein [Alphaproteobacteria bacterium]|nr:HAMP domain-containing protein [Alphaproteobacteria bacterium]